MDCDSPTHEKQHFKDIIVVDVKHRDVVAYRVRTNAAN